MKTFGLTVKAKDTLGLHYVNFTVIADTLEEADELVIKYYNRSEDLFIEFDQALDLEEDSISTNPKIIEIQGKIYFQDV